MFKKTFFVTFAVLCWTCHNAQALERGRDFTGTDRILVVAPHPDDEALGLGGMLQKAKEAGAALRVVYLTNGESNEVASIFYQKRPLLWRSDFVKSGVTRKKEAIDAMALLGFPKENLLFFGYPDGGLLTMWIRHWGASRPFRSFFTRLSSVPYKDNFSAGHVFKGDEVLNDLEYAVLSFQPTLVFVTAPFDLNTDHQAAYLFTQAALMNTGPQLVPTPEVYVYVVHAHQWPQPKRFDPDSALPIPPDLEHQVGVQWKSIPLSTLEARKKGETLLKYESQLTVKKNFLLAFARRNELYAEYPPEKIARKEAASPFEGDARSGDVRYAVVEHELWIEIPLSSMLDEMGVLSSYVFGYRQDVSFSEMPKLAFKLFGNKMFVYDGQRNFHDPRILYKLEKERLFIRIPLALLKDARTFFVSTRNAKEEMSLDFGAWRVLEIML